VDQVDLVDGTRRPAGAAQPSEVYKDRVLLYGLGNCAFDWKVMTSRRWAMRW